MRIPEGLNDWIDFLFPPHCLLCRRGLTWQVNLGLCRICLRNLPWVAGSFCPRCGRFFQGAAAPVSLPPAGLHASCHFCRQNEVFFDAGRSALRFVKPYRELLLEMKSRYLFGLAPLLARLLWQALKSFPLEERPDFLVPVPLHPMRERERGFNQSRLIADQLAGRFRIPVKTALRRIRFEASQSSLNRRQRALNSRDGFEMRAGLDFQGLHAGLVDDVLTTGHTLNECARILKAGGCRKVTLLSLFSVPRHFPSGNASS